MRSRLIALCLVPLLAACASGPAPSTRPVPTGSTARPVPPPQQPRPAPSADSFRAPKVIKIAGLESVIGKNETALANLFGPPRLAVKEGDALKLQFVGGACVLDVYLYPLQPGAQPTATFVAARRSSDGLDVDRAACVAALRR